MDRERSPNHRVGSWTKVFATIVLTLTLAACGSLGGSDNKSENPTATVSTLTETTAVPTTESMPSTPEFSTPTLATAVAGTPVSVASPVSGGMSEATPQSTNEAASLSSSGAATPAEAVSSPVPRVAATEPAATPETATPAAGGTPAAATVDSCEPDNVPEFSGSNPDYVVIEDDLNFRPGPGTDCDPVIDVLSVGVQVTVLSDPVVRANDDSTVWVQVDVDGDVGWVALEFLEPVS